MRDLCKHYQTGRCRYKVGCRHEHIKQVCLLDPPSWIYTSVSGLEHLKLHCISQDEMRYSLMYNDVRRILDDMWVDNYTKMYKYLNMVCKEGPIISPSSVCVDIRKNLEVFNLPFDIPYVESKILSLRQECPIWDENEILAGDEMSDMDIENAPSFVREYTSKEGMGDGMKGESMKGGWEKEGREGRSVYSSTKWSTPRREENNWSAPRREESNNWSAPRRSEYTRSREYTPRNESYTPRSDGYTPRSDGYTPRSDGYTPSSYNYQNRNNYQSNRNQYAPRRDDYTTRSTNYYQPRRDESWKSNKPYTGGYTRDYSTTPREYPNRGQDKYRRDDQSKKEEKDESGGEYEYKNIPHEY